jgi:hypothetical protein
VQQCAMWSVSMGAISLSFHSFENMAFLSVQDRPPGQNFNWQPNRRDGPYRLTIANEPAPHDSISPSLFTAAVCGSRCPSFYEEKVAPLPPYGSRYGRNNSRS